LGLKFKPVFDGIQTGKDGFRQTGRAMFHQTTLFDDSQTGWGGFHQAGRVVFHQITLFADTRRGRIYVSPDRKDCVLPDYIV